MMYLYSLHGYEDNTVLTHEKKFTKEEFERMCKEATIQGDEDYKYYSMRHISVHLRRHYGFKKAVYSAGFFVDADVK